MIHNAMGGARGDYRDMNKASDFLQGWNKSIANAYMLKTGMSQPELLALMNKDTWMTAQEALQNKFVDEIMFDEESRLVATVRSGISCGVIPPEVIKKFRNYMKQNETPLNEPPQNNTPPESDPTQASRVFDYKKRVSVREKSTHRRKNA
jgi:hypothetical protein